MRKTFCIRKNIWGRLFVLLLLAVVSIFSLSGCVADGYAANDRTEDSSNSARNAVSPPDEKDNGENAEKRDTDSTDNNAVLDGDPGIIGYVMSIESGRILVVNSEAKDFSSTGGVNEFYDAIWFSDAPNDIQVGEKVKVWFDVVEESYPAQSQALKTEKVPEGKPAGAALTEAEAIRKALESDELKSAFLIVVKSTRYEQTGQRWIVVLKDAMESKEFEIIIEDSAETANADQSSGGSMTPADVPEPLKADDDLQLGVLKVKMTKDEVTNTMAAKLLRSEKKDVSGIPTEFLYYEDETVIHLVEGEIYSVETASTEYATPRGLKAGDTVEQLRRLYGEPDHIDASGVWVYSARGYDLFFVTVADDKVASMKVSLVM